MWEYYDEEKIQETKLEKSFVQFDSNMFNLHLLDLE